MALDPLVGTVVRAQPMTPVSSDDLSRRFVTGQTLKGIVLRAFPKGKTLVNFGGQHVLLELDRPLSRGQTFLATVEQTSPALVLSLADDSVTQLANRIAAPTGPETLPARDNSLPASASGLDPARLKPYLVAKQPFGEMVAALQTQVLSNPMLRAIAPDLMQRLDETFSTLLPQDATPPDATGLQQQVDQSGINYEAKVQQVLLNDVASTHQAALAHDLKGQLLDLLYRLDQAPGTSPSAPPGDTAELRQQVERALQSIEFHQLANLFAHQENQSLMLQFLHPAFPDSQTAKLYFRADQKQKGSSRANLHADMQAYTMVFLLDFTALGTVRIDATVHGTSVAATIRTEDTAIADFIAAQTPSLTARLRHLGFQADVRCCAQAKVPLDIDDSLTRLLVKDPSRLLDIKT